MMSLDISPVHTKGAIALDRASTPVIFPCLRVPALPVEDRAT